MKSSLFERLTSKKKRLGKLKEKVVDYYERLPQSDLGDDQKTVLSYLKENDIAIFPYSFPAEYDATGIELFKDDALDLYYMLWDGKKLYYKNGNRPRKAREYFNSLRLEQDPRSPHRYLTTNFDVAQHDVVVDVGAAEGNFSLSVVEKAGQIYLFETDKQWIKALNATFSPWKEKVTIVQKYVADKTDGGCITLDDFFKDRSHIDFIKADVEGAESRVLQGAVETIKRQDTLKIAVCTYHRQEDATVLDKMLGQMGFSNNFSDGYMLYYYGRTNEVKEPFLRKAVLRAVKSRIK